MITSTEKNILKGCGKKFTRNKYTGFCGALRGINPIYYCDKCIGKLEGYQLAQKDIIKLFKEDSIYTGAVIKYEINNMK